MANITGDGNFRTTLQQALSVTPTSVLFSFLAFNIFFSITAFLGNVLILIALHRVTSIHPPTKILFRCLAITDLFVGLIVQPLYSYVTYILSRAKEMNTDVLYSAYSVCGAVSTILCGVSVMTSTAISVDRLLALMLGMTYRNVVTSKRVSLVIICFWVMSGSAAAIWVWREDISFKQVSVSILVNLIISIFSYTKIQLTLHKHKTQIQNHVMPGQPNGGGTPLNIARYKKTVSSILWIQLALVVCYVPYGVVAGTGTTNGIDWLATTSLLYLNSSLNPILYCWKIREVRQKAKEIIRQLYCC